MLCVRCFDDAEPKHAAAHPLASLTARSRLSAIGRPPDPSRASWAKFNWHMQCSREDCSNTLRFLRFSGFSGDRGTGEEVRLDTECPQRELTSGPFAVASTR
jgi:hypothetical protein